MSSQTLILIVLVVVALCATLVSAQSQRLSEIQSITLEEGVLRAARRVAAGPQLECLGGCSDFRPSLVNCKRIGSEEWMCSAEMPEDYQFKRVQIICEGFESPEDLLILDGSCSLSYSLKISGFSSLDGLLAFVLLGAAFVFGRLLIQTCAGNPTLHDNRCKHSKQSDPNLACWWWFTQERTLCDCSYGTAYCSSLDFHLKTSKGFTLDSDDDYYNSDSTHFASALCGASRR